MKRKIAIFSLVLAVLMCFMTVSAFAEESIGTPIPYAETEEIIPEYPDIQTGEDLEAFYEELFGENGAELLGVAVIATLFATLFFPALVLVIVFGVLNSKTKKKIKEYERSFGAVPQNIPNAVPNYYNPNTVYQNQPVNPNNAPMGTNPYNQPKNDINNQQGGQF